MPSLGKFIRVLMALLTAFSLTSAAASAELESSSVSRDLRPLVLMLREGIHSYYVKIEPIAWSGPANTSIGLERFEDAKIYIKTIKYGLFKDEVTFDGLEVFPPLIYQGYRSAGSNFQIGTNKMPKDSRPDYVGIAMCPADIAHPQNADCRSLRSALYTTYIGGSMAASKVFKCDQRPCNKEGLDGPAAMFYREPSSFGEVEFTPIDQAIGLEKIEQIKVKVADRLEFVKQADEQYVKRQAQEYKAQQSKADAVINNSRAGARLVCNSGDVMALRAGQPLTAVSYTCNGTGVDNRIQLQFLLNSGWRVVHETRTPVEGAMGNELFEVSLILER